jgi:lysyl-tRNA synthetase class 2
MKELSQALLVASAEAVLQEGALGFEGTEISLQPPFPSRNMLELVRERTGIDFDQLWDQPQQLAGVAARLGVELPSSRSSGQALFAVYDQLVEPRLSGPVFVTDYPVEVSPLARLSPDPRFVERFELVVAGRELANAFAELNDPIEQRSRLEEQARLRAEGDPEAQPFDEDFVEALEQGMPPAGGIGVGVDRLVMLLTGAKSIRDILLFPTLRPQRTEEGEPAIDIPPTPSA